MPNSDPFFSDADFSMLKSGFIVSLGHGIRVATFLAPIVLVFAIGTAIGNIGRSN